jgi:hypothetical protein
MSADVNITVTERQEANPAVSTLPVEALEAGLRPEMN